MTSLNLLYSRDDLLAMLRRAKAAQERIATTGGVEEVRVRDQVTRYHQANVTELARWIAEIEAALGINTRARSRPVYF